MEKSIFHNCRNCLCRFGCKENTNTREGFCEKYSFDEEAATCDDCDIRETCENYTKNAATCPDWEVFPTCDDCTKHDSCPNFLENGKTCDKFEEIRYVLTEKGCLCFALLDVSAENNHYVDGEFLLNSDFFETLDHEMRINKLVEEGTNNFFTRVATFFKRKKITVTARDVFRKVAKDQKYFRAFNLSETIVDEVFEKFVKHLTELYSNR